MQLIEYSDYILGKKFLTEEIISPYRMTKEDGEVLNTLFEIHPLAKKNLELIDSPKLFYSREPDLKNDIPANKREEYFYSAKLGLVSPEVPAKLIFLIKKALSYGSANFLMKIALEKDLKDIFSRGYLCDDITVRDVICNITGDKDYLPLAEGRYKVANSENFDVYVAAEDAVALLPKKLGEALSFEDISNIKLEKKELTLAGRPLAQLAGYLGVVNSIYDLRNLM